MSVWLANEKYSATLTAGYTVGQSVLSVSNVPDNVPTIIVAAKGTDKETVFSVTGKTTNSLTGVTRLRGANVNLDATTPITCLNNAEFINQFRGAAFSSETLKNLIYAADGGSTDDYAISLDPAPSEYVPGMLVVFKANTTNTGAATLNVNNLGAKAIKKNGNQDLEDNDIQAGQIVVVVYDGTNFQLVGEVSRRGTVFYTPAAGSTCTLDLSVAPRHVITMPAGNITLAVTNAPLNRPFFVEIIQDSTGSRTVTWFNTIRWAGGSAPTLTTTGGKKDSFAFICTSANNYDGYIVGQNL